MLNLFQHPTCRIRLVVKREDFQPCTYILASQRHGTIYVGVTSNLVQRLWQHRENAVAGFTSDHGVKRLVRYELFATMEGAILREKQLKRWHRDWKINLIESENRDWVDLAPGLGLAPIPFHKSYDGP